MKKILLLLLSVSLFAFVAIDEKMPSIIPVEKAYTPSIAIEDGKVVVDIKMAKGVYLYKKYIHLKEIAPQKKEIPLSFPKGIKLHGEEVFEKELRIPLPLSLFDEGNVKLELAYQGCSKIGICYPPQKRQFSLVIPKIEKNHLQKSPTNEDSIVSMLKHQSVGVILLSFFIFGLLLSLTPCVFPMIPILSSLIVGAKNMNTKKAFFYSLIYVFSMAVTYTIAGVLAGLFGSNLQAAFQNPLIITLFALIFVALAFSMFGFYEIALPASLQTKLAKKSDEAGSKGGVIGVAVMGFLSALIVGPCVAPPLAGALIYIGQTGDALLGGVALFVMSMGMGLPLLLIGTGAGKFMPKPGGWMRAVNKVFGVVMLGVAIWMIERIVPSSVSLLLWAILFIGSAVYLRAFEAIAEGSHWFVYFKKSLGLILFLYGLLLFIGAFSQGSSLLHPLDGFIKGGSFTSSKQELFEKVESLDALQKELKSNRVVVLDVTAKWCTSCKELEELTFSDPNVQQHLRRFKALRLDITDESPSDKAFLRHFHLFGPPAILIFKNGKEVKRIIGFVDAKTFVEILKEYE